MKQFITNETYLEVWNILNRNKETKELIPKEVLEHIYKNAKKSKRQFQYDMELDLITQVSETAFCLYVSLYLKYAANDLEKEAIKNILIINEIRQKAEKLEE